MDVPGGGFIAFGLLVALFSALTWKYSRRLLTVTRTLKHGVRAIGECVRVESDNVSVDAKRYFFAFRTPEGHTVEFEDLAGWSMAVGSTVTVAYDPAAPARTATIAGRGSWSPVLQCVALIIGCGFGALGFLTVFLFTVLGGQ
ncbi:MULTISPECIES: DUF3592 domain-containing protein [unclassified Streptomyces]|uniref:DUF3592 domain-containing protein n=1 Tax=unclassified Streptomyces TaxID=2593676 RepID=UPI001DF17865|nr:DUF3592 domain-containing protein [Streptomyces sp. MAG02]